MKRLTKSQYEMIAKSIRLYVDDRRESIEEQKISGVRNIYVQKHELDLLKSLALDLQQKFIVTDDQFKPRQFLEDCGF